MYKLHKKEEREVAGTVKPVRVFRNELTGSELTTYLLYQDVTGHFWWAFEDLFTIPFIRQLAAKKVLDIYGYGLSPVDVKAKCAELKALLRSNDPEKYDKCMARVLELEQLSSSMADPVKQCMGLCTVYLLLDEERPDVYLQAEQNVKMSVLGLDVDAQAFFLNWWTGHMKDSGKVLSALSRIASTVPAS